MYGIHFILIILIDFIVGEITVSVLTSKKFVHPYSLHYDIRTNYLYFSDLLNASIHRYDLATDQDYVASIENGAAPSFIIPLRRKNDQFLISDKHKVTVIDWNGMDPIAKIAREVFMVESGENTNWNIGKSSPSCRFYGGTFREVICSSDPDAIASAYMYTKLRGVKRIVKYLKVAGGIDWNIQENFFYLIDSCGRVIREYDWEPNTGNIYDGRIVYTFDSLEDKAYTPLGMTIDTEGFLYVAIYLGGEVLKINPRTKKLVQRIQIPAEAVASVAFGGPMLDILFVSTDQMPFNTTTGGISERTISPSSGSIFMIKGLNAKGYSGRKICI